MHYLDNAATTRVLPEAAKAALRVMTETFGNPSSLHRLGMEASHILESSRSTIAEALGASPDETFFTSCGTESTNLALRGVAHLHRHKKGRVITTGIEHAATRETVKALVEMGFEVAILAPDREGHITEAALSDALTDDTILFSCQLVNNELGSLQPLEGLGKLLKERCPQALFHVDAVQGLCKVCLTPSRWKCDLMSVSGHKIGAPKGVGAIYIRKGLRLPPLLYGGGQEKGASPGTEALPNIVAFSSACRIRMDSFDENNQHVAGLAAYLHDRVHEALPFAVFNVKSDVPYVQSLAIPGCPSEVMLRVLSDQEVYVSAGSACSKGKQSPVLSAIRLPRGQSDSTLRISFCPENTLEDVDAFISASIKGAGILRR